MVSNTTAENQFILIDCPLCNYEACLNLASITSFCVLLLTSESTNIYYQYLGLEKKTHLTLIGSHVPLNILISLFTPLVFSYAITSLF